MSVCMHARSCHACTHTHAACMQAAQPVSSSAAGVSSAPVTTREPSPNLQPQRTGEASAASAASRDRTPVSPVVSLSRRRCLLVFSVPLWLALSLRLLPPVHHLHIHARTHPHTSTHIHTHIHMQMHSVSTSYTYVNHVIESLQVSVMASTKPPLVVMGRDHAHRGSSQHVSPQSPLAGGSGTGSVGSRTPRSGRSRGLSHGAVDDRDDRTKWREARRKQRAVLQRNKEERKLRVTQEQRLGVCLSLCMRACVCLCAWSGSGGDGHEPIIPHSAAGAEQRSEESIRVSVLAVKSPAGAKLQVPSDPEGGKAQRRRLVSLLNVKATPANLELEREKPR